MESEIVLGYEEGRKDSCLIHSSGKLLKRGRKYRRAMGSEPPRPARKGAEMREIAP